ALTPGDSARIGYRFGITALLSHSSVRTLILEIDQSGRIVQHDRSSLETLASPGASLLGAHLSDLVEGSATAGSPLKGLLDPARSGREATAVLALGTRQDDPVDAVVSIQPMRGKGDSLSALVIMRMPPPADEQFLDPALMRHALLDDTFRQIGATLDLDQMARGLINIVVPHFCNSAGLLMLESMVAADEPPGYRLAGSLLLRRLAVANDDDDPRLDAAFPTGEVLRYPQGTPYTECLETGKPVRTTSVENNSALKIARSWRRRPVAKLLAGTSMLLLPLEAHEGLLGFIVCTRR